MGKKVVHVIGTGTIGEPLIGLLAVHAKEWGIDEVTFHKNTPLSKDRPKVEQLLKRGARLVSSADRMADFKKLGHEVAYEQQEALKQATVVIDCTPSGVGNQNKREIYAKYADRVSGFIAQGSEFGFGKMYARGINDEVLDAGKDQFLHVVSCNTHNISVVLKAIATASGGKLNLDEARFVCLRRANDLSQEDDFVAAPEVGKHGDDRFGTHHARDAHHLFETLGYDLNLFSSACVLNTQYMHALHFAVKVPFKLSRDEVINRFRENKRVAITEKRAANLVFSFGREHGHYGRILNQTVLSVPTLTVRNGNEVVGFCFTPQDGNSLLSSIAATLWYLDKNNVEKGMDVLRPYLFAEV